MRPIKELWDVTGNVGMVGVPGVEVPSLAISCKLRHTGSGTNFLTMRRKRAHVILPEDLLAEVDRLVGERGRSAFLAEVVQREIQRRKLLAALREAKGSWKTENHPELAEGSEAFVERLRQENDERLKSLPDA